jgi:endonuclease YncB( thermonuclease family)
LPWLALMPSVVLGGTTDSATVLRIADGDSLLVQQGSRQIQVRLACIDAPELQQAPWGAMARSYLETRLPPGRQVQLRPVDRDRYGRTVAEVISEINIGLAMVEDGQAFVERRHLNGCDALEYLEAEARAARHRYGIWQQPGGISRPWQVRQRR